MTLPDSNFQASPKGIDLDLVKDADKRLTALIVDDEPETIRMMKYVLMDAGMDVIGATSGLDAIDKCPHAQPDVILLDSDDAGNGWIRDISVFTEHYECACTHCFGEESKG